MQKNANFYVDVTSMTTLKEKYDEIIEIDENIHIRFNDAGHMLGSAMIEVWVTEDGKQQKIVFSGDIGNKDLPFLMGYLMFMAVLTLIGTLISDILYAVVDPRIRYN